MGVAFVQRLAREPLLHFALIGALLFLAYEATRPVGPDRDRVVDIDRHALNRLATQWQAQWRRPPTRAELERLVAARVQEEVLYREAVALGLDRGDPVVRRRLGQKLSIAWADLAALELPEEAELTAYYEAHLDRYRANNVIIAELIRPAQPVAPAVVFPVLQALAHHLTNIPQADRLEKVRAGTDDRHDRQSEDDCRKQVYELIFRPVDDRSSQNREVQAACLHRLFTNALRAQIRVRGRRIGAKCG